MKIEIDIETIKNLLEQIIHETNTDKNIKDFPTLWHLIQNKKNSYSQKKDKNYLIESWIKELTQSIKLKTEPEPEPEPKFKNIERKEPLMLEKNDTSLPPTHTLLDDADLPENILKLFKRLKNINTDDLGFSLGNTIEDILNLSMENLRSLPGVGRLYLDTFEELRDLYTKKHSSAIEENIDLTSIDLNDFFIGYSEFNKNQIKTLAKLSNHGITDDIQSLLNISIHDLRQLPYFGDKFVEYTMKIKKMITKELQDHCNGVINIKEWESKIILPISSGEISIEKLDEIIFKDTDNYLDKIPERDSDILQKRWGYLEDKQTLEQVGNIYKVHRERIRQIEKKLNDMFSRNLRFTKNFIWDIVESELSPELPKKMSNIHSYIENEKDFYNFLEVITGQKKIEDHIRPIVNHQVLNSYFSENGGPIDYDEIKDYLLESNLNQVNDMDNAILYLAQKKIIKIENNTIYPLNLKKHEAAAFVLANNSGGLPWRDIAIIANKWGCSRYPFSETNLEYSAFQNPDRIYLAARGVYKHTRFIDFESIDIDDFFNELRIHFDKNNCEPFHLSECCRASKILNNIDYYVVRHIVKNLGENFGFFFNGSSQKDSVGLEKGFKSVTQTEVIIRAMNNNEKPLTKKQIAALLKSNSINHASYYLDKMIDSGQAVQVERMLYTTQEKAYSHIDKDLYIREIGKTLLAAGKPVDPSIFSELLNHRLSVSFSRYFYASIARASFHEKGWFRKHGLYSSTHIVYKNLLDAVNQHCDSNQTNEHNLSLLKRHIEITSKSAVMAITAWRKEIKLGNL